MKWEAGGNATVTLTENTSLKSNFIHSTEIPTSPPTWKLFCPTRVAWYRISAWP